MLSIYIFNIHHHPPWSQMKLKVVQKDRSEWMNEWMMKNLLTQIFLKKNEPEFFPGHRGIYGLTNTKIIKTNDRDEYDPWRYIGCLERNKSS